MPMKEQYFGVRGQTIGYKTGGQRKDFLTDNLGSVTAEIDQTGTNRTFNGRYQPYGGSLWATGTRGNLGWIGALGYWSTGLSTVSHYIRARHYGVSTGGWFSIDPLWPTLSPYGYVVGRPTKLYDYLGLGPSSCISGSKSFPLAGWIMVEIKYKICGSTYERICCPEPGATVCIGGEIGIGFHISVLGALQMLEKLSKELLETLHDIQELMDKLSHLSVQAGDASQECPEKLFEWEFKACIEVCLAFVTISACDKGGKLGFEPPEYGFCDPGISINASESFKWCY